MPKSRPSSDCAAAALQPVRFGQRREWLDVRETAQFLNISVGLVRAMVADGRLPAQRFGRLIRIPMLALEKLARM